LPQLIAMLNNIAKADIRADLRIADAITMGGAPLMSKQGEKAKRDWRRKMEKELSD
jgi:hypothetical protein